MHIRSKIIHFVVNLIYNLIVLKAPEQNALGNLLVMFLLGGIFTGVALDWLWIIGNGSF